MRRTDPTQPDPQSQVHHDHWHVNQPQNRRRGLPGWAWVLIIGGIVALLCGGGALALAGGDDDPAPTKSPAAVATIPQMPPVETTDLPAVDDGPLVVKIGQTITAESYDSKSSWTVTKVEQKTVAQYDQKPERGVFVLAHVKVTVTEGTEYVCGCSLQFVAANGKVYDNDYNSFKGREDMPASEVGKGQNTDGWVAFDVPKSAIKGGRIQWKSSMLDDKPAFWAL